MTMKKFAAAKSWFLPALAAWVLAATVSPAQEADVSGQRKIYREITAREKSMTKVSATAPGDGGEVSLTGWLDGGELRKITAKPGISGSGFDEFYLDGGRPVFVFSTIRQEGGGNVEERIYLDGEGEVVKWLSGDPSFVPHSEDRESMAGRVRDDVRRFAAALRPGKPDARTRTATGVFTGIEQGDYAHWTMRESDGTERSFFMLQTNAALDRVAENPAKFEGRPCRVRWERRKEDIPEAGGPMEVDVLLGVEWR